MKYSLSRVFFRSIDKTNGFFFLFFRFFGDEKNLHIFTRTRFTHKARNMQPHTNARARRIFSFWYLKTIFFCCFVFLFINIFSRSFRGGGAHVWMQCTDKLCVVAAALFSFEKKQQKTIWVQHIHTDTLASSEMVFNGRRVMFNVEKLMFLYVFAAVCVSTSQLLSI